VVFNKLKHKNGSTVGRDLRAKREDVEGVGGGGQNISRRIFHQNVFAKKRKTLNNY